MKFTLLNKINPFQKEVAIIEILDDSDYTGNLMLLKKVKNKITIQREELNYSLQDLNKVIDTWVPIVLVFNQKIITYQESKAIFEKPEFNKQVIEIGSIQFYSYLRKDYLEQIINKLSPFHVVDYSIGWSETLLFKEQFGESFSVKDKQIHLNSMDIQIETTNSDSTINFAGQLLTNQNILSYCCGLNYFIQDQSKSIDETNSLKIGKENYTYITYLKYLISIGLPIVLFLVLILELIGLKYSNMEELNNTEISAYNKELEIKTSLESAIVNRKKIINDFNIDFKTNYSKILYLVGETVPASTRLNKLIINPIDLNNFEENEFDKENGKMEIYGYSYAIKDVSLWSNEIKDSLQLNDISFKSFNSEEESNNFYLQGIMNR